MSETISAHDFKPLLFNIDEAIEYIEFHSIDGAPPDGGEFAEVIRLLEHLKVIE